MPATIDVDGDIETLDDATVEAAYAIASEALANAAKHSGAPDARVALAVKDETLHIEVHDRGRGIEARHDVRDRHAHFRRRPLHRSRDAHEAAHALGDKVEAAAVGVGACPSEA